MSLSETSKLDLCKELIFTMKDYEFQEKEIEKVTSNHLFIDALSKEPGLQKAILTLMLYRIVVYSKIEVTRNIKLALNATVGNLHWLDNIKLSVIPFIRDNKILAN